MFLNLLYHNSMYFFVACLIKRVLLHIVLSNACIFSRKSVCMFLCCLEICHNFGIVRYFKWIFCMFTVLIVLSTKSFYVTYFCGFLVFCVCNFVFICSFGVELFYNLPLNSCSIFSLCCLKIWCIGMLSLQQKASLCGKNFWLWCISRLEIYTFFEFVILKIAYYTLIFMFFSDSFMNLMSCT